MKKVFTKITCFIILIINIFGMSLLQTGCKWKRYEQVTIGDYEYYIVTDKYDKPIYWVIDLSKEGKQKEILVYNNLVNDIEVKFGTLYDTHSYGGYLAFSRLNTKKMKKLLIEKYVNVKYSYYNNRILADSSIIYIIDRTLFNKVNFKAVVNYNLFDKIYYEDYDHLCVVYMRKSVLENNISRYIESKKRSTNFFNIKEYCNFLRPANVEFHWNYENSPQEDYYWIDDIEDGELIEEIPPTPEREGYIFGGWYTEKECLSEFNFGTPISKMKLDWEKVFLLEDNIPDNYVTCLYAKWIKI